MAQEQTEQYTRNDDVSNNLLANIDNGIIILDEELSVLHFNTWLEVHTKVKELDILNKKIYEIFPSINAKTLKRKIKTCLTMNSPVFYAADTTKYFIPIKINQIKVTDFEHMRQDVRIIPLDIEKKIITIIITDQTNMINTQELLKRNVQRVEELNQETLRERQIIDERVNLIKIDNNSFITDVSHAYLNLLHVSKENLVGKNIFELEKAKISHQLKEEILKHMKDKTVFKYEQISNDANGKELSLYHTLVPDYNDQNENNGFIIFADNITDSKLIQQQQEKLLETSRSAAMGEMISMIAHQWRQPLSAINTVIASLRIKKELGLLNDELMDTSYEKIEKTVTFLSETIDDFRNFFKQNKELADTNLCFVFEKSKSFIDEDIQKGNITYTENIDKSISFKTYQNELIQAIMNFMKNSVDAFKTIEIENKNLEVFATEDEKDIHITIEDNAGGIPSENLVKIFEPYFSTKSKNGTGLGLYVCKTIIEDHLNGSLKVQSKDNKTKIIIRLPKNL